MARRTWEHTGDDGMERRRGDAPEGKPLAELGEKRAAAPGSAPLLCACSPCAAPVVPCAALALTGRACSQATRRSESPVSRGSVVQQAPLPKPGDFLTSSTKGLRLQSPSSLSGAETPPTRRLSPRTPVYAGPADSDDTRLFARYSRDPFIRAMSPSHEDHLAKTGARPPTSPRGQPGLVNDTCGFRPYCGGEAGGGMHMYQQTSFKETIYMLPGSKKPATAWDDAYMRPARLKPMPAPQPSYDQLRVPTPATVDTAPYEPGGWYSPHIPTANPANYWSPRSSTKSTLASPGAPRSAKSGSATRKPYVAPVRGGGYTQGGDQVQLVRPVSREGTGQAGDVYGRGPRPETPVGKHPHRATFPQAIEATEPSRAWAAGAVRSSQSSLKVRVPRVGVCCVSLFWNVMRRVYEFRFRVYGLRWG